jgi:hypothetical protein
MNQPPAASMEPTEPTAPSARLLRTLLPAAAAVAAAVIAVPLLAAAGVGEAPPAAAGGIAAVAGIPPTLLDAYNRAAQAVTGIAPGCTGMRWSVLAGVGMVESQQAAGRTISPDGEVDPPVIGPRLDGSGAGGNTTPVRDTDHGRWDGDSSFDHAVGALQFLPGTWQAAGQDGNGDGVADPHNVYDNTLAAAGYLCGSQPVDLADRAELTAALLRYNHSDDYVQKVLGWIDSYDQLAVADVGPVDATGSAKTVIDAAMRWAGTPYAWGGGDAAGPTRGTCVPGAAANDCRIIGFDCSGLTLNAFAQVGIALPHSSAVQFTMGSRVPREDGLAALRPGDLIFYAFDPIHGTGVHHVGLYLGGGKMINAPYSGSTVRIDQVDVDQYAGGVRLLGP